jgi:hypothetical protein
MKVWNRGTLNANMKIKFDCLRFSLKQSNVIISHIIFNKYNLLMLNFLFTFLYSYTSSRKHQPRVGNNILWSWSMGRIFCFQKTKFLIFFLLLLCLLCHNMCARTPLFLCLSSMCSSCVPDVRWCTQVFLLCARAC